MDQDTMEDNNKIRVLFVKQPKFPAKENCGQWTMKIVSG